MIGSNTSRPIWRFRRPGTFSTKRNSGLYLSTNLNIWLRIPKRSSPGDTAPRRCWEKGWQGAQTLNHNGWPAQRSTNRSKDQVGKRRMSTPRKSASGKLTRNVRSASGSLSTPRAISMPAAFRPQLVPPQPQKRSNTFTGFWTSIGGRCSVDPIPYPIVREYRRDYTGIPHFGWPRTAGSDQTRSRHQKRVYDRRSSHNTSDCSRPVSGRETPYQVHH